MDEPDWSDRSPREPPSLVVGIGASAGGPKALKELVSHLPADSGLAYVVVLHLAPEYESHLAEILQTHTDLPVTQVITATLLQADHLYVIPPNFNLDALDSHLRLSKLEDHRTDRGPIDHFFRTLASSHDGKAVGVVLTGAGTDGALGIRAIKGSGGLTIAQDPKEAEYASMPKSALETGAVDLRLPLAEIPHAIARYAGTRPRVPVVREEGLNDEGQRFLQEIFRTLLAHVDRDFRRYKPSTILRRIQHRMQLRQIEELKSYVSLLKEDADEIEALADDLLITVTCFFRDSEYFETLEEKAIPELFASKDRDDELRVWSVACATGEEAYSLAILLLEEAGRRKAPTPRIRVFATDLHEPSLKRGREGLFTGEIQKDVSAERLDRFFTVEDGGYRIRTEVRDLIVFARHDILRDPPFSHMDLVACRNLLIYLDRDAQADVFRILHYSLEPGGKLLLGTSETIGDSDLFEVAAEGLHLYSPRDVAHRELPQSTFSVSRSFPEATTESKRRRSADRSPGELHHIQVERYAPPSMLLDSDDETIHVSEHAARYLQFPGGTPTAAATSIVLEALQTELARVLRQARAGMEPVRSRPVELSIGGRQAQVVMDARPSPNPRDEGYVLVIFDERPHPVDEEVPEGEDTSADGQDGKSYHEAETKRDPKLEAELKRTRARLRAEIEDHAANREKMQAANEELQSMNEELRSTLEELETSKEELQSMNEELQTLNQENQHKVEELNVLTSDLKNLLSATDIATLFLDREFRIRRFTPRVPDLFSIRTSDLGRPISDLTHRLNYDRMERDAEQVLTQLTPVEREVQDDEGRTYLTRALPYRSTDDRIDGVVINFVDITSRKQMEEELRASKTFAEDIVETLHEPLLVLTSELKVIHANPAFLRHFNVQPDETLDRKIYDLGNGQWNIPELRKLLKDVVSANATFSEFEIEHDFDSLGKRIMRLNARKIDDIDRILLGIRDITAQRKLEKHLRQRQRLESIGALAGGVAHDFNNLLMSVEGHATLLMEDLPEDSPLQDDLYEIQQAGRRAARLTNHLLAFSREQILQPRNVQLGRTIQPLDDLLQGLLPGRVEWSLVVASDDPVVRIDPAQFQQVIVNLVKNAADAMVDGGRISVEVDAITVSEEEARAIPWSFEPGSFGRLTVRDTGVGMTPDVMERIFEPFFTTRSDVGQAGLGLSAAFGIVKQSGGHILVESTPGEGSTFRVLLPSHPDESVAAASGEGHLPEGHEEAPVSGGQTILVVEDEDPVRRVACEMLKRAGYSCIGAANADEALVHLQDSDRSIDLVLTDMMMPGLTGLDLIERIEKIRPEAVVVLMSGYARPELHREKKVGTADFLPKPFSRDELLDSIRTALERAGD